ncbi:alpha/beta hydrolase [Jiangella aurantiaca]|nr:alpha/beta hydrolase [Jiangella aurantiaca]
MAELVGADPRLAAVRVEDATVPYGSRGVRVRVYRPPLPDGDSVPAFVHLFGGGWWQSTFDGPDMIELCRRTALDAGVIVVQVDYALAPERPYPAALEEAYAVLGWLAGGVDGLPVDPGAIAVGGVSAGANLAAALCRLARDRGGPAIALQVLEVPALDATLELYDVSVLSALGSGDDSRPAPSLVEAWDGYVGSADRADPYVSPVRAADFAGLPAALILTAEFDPLWREGRAYGDALADAGVRVVSVTYGGQIHGAPSLSALSASSRAWRAQVSWALRTLPGGW